MFAIADCNNFYASCERVFNPKLIGKPIVILSNNDGCVISRSNEAKSLGIKMGQPYFQIKKFCESHNCEVRSSNYILYGDMSKRVMSIIEENWPEVEIYSIDEAFLDLSSLTQETAIGFSNKIYRQVYQYTGIPISIGLSSTKTLAKLANFLAKRIFNSPIYHLQANSPLLENIPIGEIWGIGKQLKEKLNQLGIFNAKELQNSLELMMARKAGKNIQQTILELRGTPCFALEPPKQKKSIVSSKSFGKPLNDFQSIFEALAHYTALASEKLRLQNSTAGMISVFLKTNPYDSTIIQKNNASTLRLATPTNDVRDLTNKAKTCLESLFETGYYYQKVGICLEKIESNSIFQNDLFFDNESNNTQSALLMETFDSINQRFGKGSIKTAAEGIKKTWKAKQERLSCKKR